jgi:hypothetical protein
MDFSLPASFEPLLARYRDFMQNDVLPLEADVGAKGFVAMEPTLREVREKAKKLGRACRSWSTRA